MPVKQRPTFIHLFIDEVQTATVGLSLIENEKIMRLKLTRQI